MTIRVHKTMMMLARWHMVTPREDRFSYGINADNSVNVHGNIDVYNASTMITNGVEFDVVTGDVRWYQPTKSSASTTHGIPRTVGGSCGVFHREVDHLPDWVCGNLVLASVSHLHDFHKKFPKLIVNQQLVLGPTIASHTLSLLLIPGIGRVKMEYIAGNASHVGKMLSIINKHLAGERDVIACQDELIDSGLHAYAQL